jgi:serine/threonine protein kinase
MTSSAHLQTVRENQRDAFDQFSLGGLTFTSGGSESVFKRTFDGQRTQITIRVVKTLGSEDWKSEVAMLATLNHPNIVKVLGYSAGPHEGDHACILLEHALELNIVDNLRAIKCADARLRQALDWCLQVGEGLAYLHSLNPPVLHLDLKPQNILLFEDGTAKICDFGTSKLLSGRFDDTASPEDCAHCYAAPEVLLKDVVSVQTDLYSFGCVLLELITGEAPLKNGSITELKEGKEHDLQSYEWPPKTEALQGLVASLLSFNPEERVTLADAVATLKMELFMLETSGAQHVPNRPAVKSVIEPTHVKVNVPACPTAASATKDGAFACIGRLVPPLSTRSYEKANHHRSLRTSLQYWINGFVALTLVLSVLCAFLHRFADVQKHLEDDDNLGIQVPQSGATTHTTLGTIGGGAKYNESGATPPTTSWKIPASPAALQTFCAVIAQIPKTVDVDRIGIFLEPHRTETS